LGGGEKKGNLGWGGKNFTQKKKKKKEKKKKKKNILNLGSHQSRNRLNSTFIQKRETTQQQEGGEGGKGGGRLAQFIEGIGGMAKVKRSKKSRGKGPILKTINMLKIDRVGERKRKKTGGDNWVGGDFCHKVLGKKAR